MVLVFGFSRRRPNIPEGATALKYLLFTEPLLLAEVKWRVRLGEAALNYSDYIC